MSSEELQPLLHRTSIRVHGVWTDFKKFIDKGSVVDLSVAIVIGNAFTDVVNSFVNDIFTPLVGLIITTKLSETFIVLKRGPHYPYLTRDDAKADGAITWNYGIFCQYAINFLLISVCLFMLVKSIQKIKRKEKAKIEIETPKKECAFCFTVIHSRAKKCPSCTADL